MVNKVFTRFSWSTSTGRSCRAEVLLKNVLLEILQGCRMTCNFIKNETPAPVFSCEFCEIFKETFLHNFSERLLFYFDCKRNLVETFPPQFCRGVFGTLSNSKDGAVSGFWKRHFAMPKKMFWRFGTSKKFWEIANWRE